jgi:hypothetical protein
MRIRYTNTTENNRAFRELFGTRTDLNYWDYINWEDRFGSYERVTPVLRSLGITPNDKVICPNDGSYDITLYLMDQKGWPNLCNWLSDSSSVSKLIVNKGARYMIVSDTSILNGPNLKPYSKHKMATFERLHIYDLRPYVLNKK